MLKKVYFEGMIMVDFKKDPANKWDYENCVQEAIDDHGASISISSVLLKKASDIPSNWMNAIPYGDRGDDKKCIDIYYDEVVPKIELDDKKQGKFEFFDQVKQKKEEVKDGKVM